MGGGSRHRRLRYATALVLSSVVVLASAPPASGIIDPTAQCWTISGTVMDPFSRAVPGALIETSRGCEGPVSVVTDSSGGYSLSVSGNLLGASAAITISKSGFAQQGKSVSASAIGAQSSNSSSGAGSSNAAASSAGGVLDPDDVVDTNDVVLQYDPGATVTPALRSGETLALSARNPAPPATGTSDPGARVRVDLPDGSTQQLVAGTTDSEGFTTWTGSYAVPAAAAEGSYAAVFCVVEQSFIGSCAQAQQVHESGTNVLVSPLQTELYDVDNTAPVVAETVPQRFRTLLTAQPFGARWFDGGSGIDPASLALRLDGQLAPASVSATAITLPAGAMTPGVHLVEISATDLAGNDASDSFIFTLAEFSATDTEATVQPATTTVIQRPGLLPSGYARFTDVTIDIGAFTETLTASTWVGTGTVDRDIVIGDLSVIFDNGLAQQPVSHEVPAVVSSHGIAVLAPSGTELAAPIPPNQVVLAEVIVEAPLGFHQEGTEARLVQKDGIPVESHVVLRSDGLLDPLVDEVLVTGELGACFDDASDQVEVNCFGWADDGQGVITARVGDDGKFVTLHPLQLPLDDDRESVAAHCSDQGEGFGCVSVPPDPTEEPYPTGAPDQASRIGLVFGCPRHDLGGGLIDLCTGRPPESPTGPDGEEQPWSVEDGYFSAWLNPAVYRTVGGTRPLWQQNHADIDSLGDSCPNGRSGRVTAGLYRLATNSLAYDGAAVALDAGTDSFGDTGLIDVYLGYRTGTQSETTDPPEGDPSRSYQLSTTQPGPPGLKVRPRSEGYLLIRGQRQDPLGRPTSDPQASVNLWEADDDELASASVNGLATGRIQLVAGTDFDQAAGDDGYRRAATLAFQFVADFSPCTP